MVSENDEAMNSPANYLVPGEDPEGLHYLLGGISVGCFSGHKIKECLECHVSCTVWIYNGHKPFKLLVSLWDENHMVSEPAFCDYPLFMGQQIAKGVELICCLIAEVGLHHLRFTIVACCPNYLFLFVFLLQLFWNSLTRKES